jgi:hypothetical protein
LSRRAIPAYAPRAAAGLSTGVVGISLARRRDNKALFCFFQRESKSWDKKDYSLFEAAGTRHRKCLDALIMTALAWHDRGRRHAN